MKLILKIIFIVVVFIVVAIEAICKIVGSISLIPFITVFPKLALNYHIQEIFRWRLTKCPSGFPITEKVSDYYTDVIEKIW